MPTAHDPHNVREFVKNLAAGTRVIWIANGAKGTVQADKAIQWDDGSRMTHRQMNHSHALLIHSEAEWRRMNESLSSIVNCFRCGGTVERWDASGRKGERPEKICPLAVLSDPEAGMAPLRGWRRAGAVRLGSPRGRNLMRV
jgi:hypothetical protein